MNGVIIRRAVKCGNSAHVMLPIGWRNRPVVVIDVYEIRKVKG